MHTPPPWAPINLPWREFCYGAITHPLCYTGAQVEVRSAEDDYVRRYLIGDINEEGGMCGDCCAIHADDVVLRARRLIPSELLSQE